MGADPTIWILSAGRKGDLDQMLALARAVGWPFEVKQLSFGPPGMPILARNRVKDDLSPPWPDVVFCAEAAPSVIAKSVKQRSGGRTRAVCIGRPSGATTDFDLVITTAQYRVPAAPNVVELSIPLAADLGEPPPPAPDGPIALIIGGPAFPDVFDGAVTEKLAADALAYATRRNRPLVVQTSPRTPKEAIAVLDRRITAPNRLEIFGRGENRYRAVLAEASEVIVTSDSVSMVADALAAARPVSVYPLPQSRSFKWTLGEWLYRNALEKPKALFTPVRWLFEKGLIESAADRKRLFARLAGEGRLVWFGEPLLPPSPGGAPADLERAVARLKSLMDRST